jgi:hypothetical protein
MLTGYRLNAKRFKQKKAKAVAKTIESLKDHPELIQAYLATLKSNASVDALNSDSE